jgi:hypothetical protein
VRNDIRHFQNSEFQSHWNSEFWKGANPILTPLGLAYWILWKHHIFLKMNVFDTNNSFQMINYWMMDFGIFVLFFCILVVIPYLILRFVTFTQKSEFLCDMIFQHFLHTCMFYHSKSDNCGYAAVSFCAYFWAAMAPATRVVI